SGAVPEAYATAWYDAYDNVFGASPVDRVDTFFILFIIFAILTLIFMIIFIIFLCLICRQHRKVRDLEEAEKNKADAKQLIILRRRDEELGESNMYNIDDESEEAVSDEGSDDDEKFYTKYEKDNKKYLYGTVTKAPGSGYYRQTQPLVTTDRQISERQVTPADTQPPTVVTAADDTSSVKSRSTQSVKSGKSSTGTSSSSSSSSSKSSVSTKKSSPKPKSRASSKVSKKTTSTKSSKKTESSSSESSSDSGSHLPEKESVKSKKSDDQKSETR
ncbi:MAG: hypothetical protein EZS28_053048, partial [Streblomastix strix]